jgi:hypothetical protein
MQEFEKFVKRLHKVKEFIEKKASKEMLKLGDDVADMNRFRLKKGLDTEKELIQQGYSKQYGKKRKAKGFQTKFVDLKFVGNWPAGIKLKKTTMPDEFMVETDWDKEKYLRERFDKKKGKILGLTEEQAEIIKKKIVKEESVNDIKTYLLT